MAYSICTTRRQKIDDGELLALCDLMSYNYDVEPQSRCDGWGFTREDGSYRAWHRRLRPVCPVQISKTWSPFPLASRLLGSPAKGEVRYDYSSSASFFWDRHALESIESGRSDPAGGKQIRRCVLLITEALIRARRTKGGLVICARVGWWGMDPDAHGFTPEIARSMQKKEYAVTDRWSIQ